MEDHLAAGEGAATVHSRSVKGNDGGPTTHPHGSPPVSFPATAGGLHPGPHFAGIREENVGHGTFRVRSDEEDGEGAARGDRRPLPRDERGRHQPGHLGQHLGATRGPDADHPLGDALRAIGARNDRLARARRPERRVGRPARALDRVAFPSRAPVRPRRRGGSRSCAPDLLHHAGHRPKGDPGLPLHDCGVRREQCPLLRLRDFRHGRSLPPRHGGDDGAQRLPAREPRHDLDRRHRSRRRCGGQSSWRPSRGSTTSAC